MDLEDIHAALRSKCLKCFSSNRGSEVLDISLGYKDVRTEILVRSSQAKGKVERAIKLGYITEVADFGFEASVKKIAEMA